MKKYCFIGLLLNCSLFAMDSPLEGKDSSASITAPPSLENILKPSLEETLKKDNTFFERFYILDPSSSTPILQQFQEQAVAIYQARQEYLETQKEFLIHLAKQACEQDGRNLQSLHPWFYNTRTTEIFRILEENIVAYDRSIQNTAANIARFSNNKGTLEDLFASFVTAQLNYLDYRVNNRKVTLVIPTKPSLSHSLEPYENFVAQESRVNARLIDEAIYALFPYISREWFDKIDRDSEKGRRIKQNYSLLSFLAGKLSIPHDPDTMWENIEATRKKTIYKGKGSQGEQMVEDYKIILPEANRELYNYLRCLLKSTPPPTKQQKKDKEADTSFLPDHVKNSGRGKRRQHPHPASAAGSKASKASQPTCASAVLAPLTGSEQKATPRIASPSSAIITTAPMPSAPLKPLKPQGGWSLRDQQRNTEASSKHQQRLTTSLAEQKLHTQFRPEKPIILSGGQFQTLQMILSEETPAYTLTFNKVRDLIEGLGIPVERRAGGSHAYIHTPGHNMKNLVDIHYGWTDKYGPGTMKNLRTLMQNLGLDNPNFVSAG